MKARMEKYETASVSSRTEKNERLYNEVQNMNIDYVNINVDNAVDLSSASGNNYSRENYQKQRELNKILPRESKSVDLNASPTVPKEDRIYDIDEILKMARDNQLFEDSEKKRLINTEYNILTKLDVGSLQNDEMKKEDIRSLIDSIYENEKPKKPKKYSRKEEDRLLSDLFEDNEDDKNDLEEEIKLKEELSKNILAKEKDESFDSDNSDELDSTDDVRDTLPKINKEEKEDKKQEVVEVSDDFIEVKEGKGLIIAIVIVIVLILAICGFFVYDYFFGI